MILYSKTFKILLLFSIYLLPFIFSPAVSADTDVEKIRRDIEELKSKIAELESMKKRLHDMELALESAEKSMKNKNSEVENRKDEDSIDIGGAVRFSYAYRDFQKENQSKAGDFEFDIFRINADGKYNDFLFSAEYRWYSFMHVIHHGWIGRNIGDTWQVNMGVTRVPFGILPFASHNWWFGVPYYVGLEDDYDLGIKFIKNSDPWNLQFAFFKNGEWGSSSETERYSFDVVRSLNESNEETNQFNARIAYRINHGNSASTEIGVSGMWGQLYNSVTDSSGSRWATAFHLNGNYSRWNLMLEAGRYDYNPKNPPGIDSRTVIMGAFGTAFPVASEGNIIVANLSYDLPFKKKYIHNIKFYENYSILVKDEKSFEDTQINTIGLLISTPPVYTYVDLIMGKNAPFLGVPVDISGVSRGLGPGEPYSGWQTRFNVNIALYF